MNIFKITFANIRKRKGAGITFLIMVILAALMLTVSLSLMIGGANFYDKKVEELKAPHYSNFIVTEKYKDEFRVYAEEYQGTTDVSVMSSLCAIATWKYASVTNTGTNFFYDIAEANEKSFYKPKIVDEVNKKPMNMIYMPVSVRAAGVKSGEIIHLEIAGKSYEFTVCGFFEDALFGASTMGGKIGYINSEYYNALKVDENYSYYTSIFVRFEKSAMSNTFKSDFRKLKKLNNSDEFVTTVDASKAASMTFVDMAAMVMIVFSVIILLIAFIVVAFSINNSIAEDITTIGALKGIGYKNRILRISQLMQYLLIALIGSLIGALISLFTFGLLGNIIASTSGLLWLSGANIMPVFITMLIICILTTLITLIATRKYKRITPINALRQGENNHSFKKNVMPLEKHNMPLNLHLGTKRLFNSIKNNTILCMVVALLVLISSVVNVVSYNLNGDRTAMIRMVGLEYANVWVMPNSSADIYEINEELKADGEVDRTLLVATKQCMIDDYEGFAEAVEDYSKLTINTLVKGSYPTLKNEIVLGAVAANAINKGIGDTVVLEIDGAKLSYVVVGISQGIATGGGGCNIIFEAMNTHNDQITMDTIYVYLKKGVDASAFNDKIKVIYGNKVLTANTEEQMETILSSLGNPFAAITIVMIVATVIIIGFVLFLLISALIRKQKKELGIMKAIGYKNHHLIMQLLISLLPSLALGTLIGIILTFIITNPLLSMSFTSMGLLKTYFIIPVLSSILIGLGVFGVSVIAAYLISSRLKKISPQKLIIGN